LRSWRGSSRDGVGHETGGDISPLVGYDAKADRFLLLDVAIFNMDDDGLMVRK
jgi:hypothetical protein